MAAFDQDLFDKYIEVDPIEAEDGKENLDVSQSAKEEKVTKPTKEQYEKIASFYRVNMEEYTEKSVLNELWGQLAAELNDIGPPEFTEREWKRKWAVQKYNDKKRRLKRLAESEISFDETGSAGSFAGNSTGGTVSTVVDEKSQTNILDYLVDISMKQNLLLRNQNIMKEDVKSLKADFNHYKQQLRR